jgi:tetraacyldisaccharide 4'-kinase
MFREARRVGCGLVMVNGRISDKALPAYERYVWLFREVLGLCDQILTQSELMSARFAAAGAPAAVLTVAGNLKYDFKPGCLAADSALFSFLQQPGPVWIAASTSADDAGMEEEDAVIAAQANLPGWRLILAPRKPERFDRVARKLEAAGVRFTRRSSLTDPAAPVLLLDSIGELSAAFAHASVVFMGGTLADRGGHNVLEPAIFGKPVIAGPHLENFRDIEAHFEAHRALLRIPNGTALASAVRQAAADPDLGKRALQAAQAQQGAADRAATVVLELHRTRYPSERPPQPGFMFLWAFSKLWAYFSARDRRSKLARRRRLPVPVVSVGNITAGGTGKTPATIELIQAFDSPALLTRGYGRSTSGTLVVLPADRPLPTALTGDETQLYLRRCRVPVGIGGDRYDAGERLLRVARPNVFFLDDGFQHVQLHREFDLVLIDSLHPFGGGNLLPLGRLREPLEGLARAHAFLITRADQGTNLPAIEYQLRRYNPAAPIFHAHTEPLRWVNKNGDTRQARELAGLPAIAFCGLGNPNSFWRTLASQDLHPIEQYSYGDHHHYPPMELKRLARHALDIGVTTLLCTEKDAVNLCPDFEGLISPLQLWWLEIGMEIDRREELLALIRDSI